MAGVSRRPETLVGKDVPALEQMMVQRGEKQFRGRQLAKWIYQRGARSVEEMTDLPKGLRSAMALEMPLGALEVVQVARSKDETQKALLQVHDGPAVEGVIMRHDHRWTMCVSSQAGCALKCGFCMTGTLGLRRNLTAGEMVDQVLLGRRMLAEADPEARLTNLVFMGMGEPLLNMDSLVEALRLLTSPQCVAMSPRRITVSTAGVIPGIERLGHENVGVNLALSLNATTQALRRMLMPHAERWPLEPLMEAVRAYPLAAHRRVTLEYVLLADVNDSIADARRLAKLARGLRCKINLIPFNEAEPLPFQRPTPKVIERFQQILLAENYTVSVRYSKGRSIGAACGQLAGLLARSAA